MSPIRRAEGVQVTRVAPGGLADRAGLRAGDRILEIHGEPVLDQLNYQYLVSLRDLTSLRILRPDGTEFRRRLRNGGDGLGLDLAQDPIRTCRANCVFCFVQQMPAGFRRSLYLRDEDERLSFLYGHFTTLSNCGRTELDRIVRERLSPIHVSVHATDPEQRMRVLRHRGAGEILAKLDHLIAGGILVHTQAVIAPGYNDGATWERTLADLWARRALQQPGRGGVLSLSCVPVGLTDHREGLPPVRPFSPEESRAWVRRWTPEARVLARQNAGEPWLLMADEWYTRAGGPPPGRGFYSRDWSQWENGVGMVRRFLEHARRFRESRAAGDFRGRRLLLLTGASFHPFLASAVEDLNARTGAYLRVCPVPNRAFGDSVTVAGLLCGRDLLAAARADLARHGETEAVVFPSAALRRQTGPTDQYALPRPTSGAEGLFLDDLTPGDLARDLGIPACPGGLNLRETLVAARRITASE